MDCVERCDGLDGPRLDETDQGCIKCVPEGKGTLLPMRFLRSGKTSPLRCRRIFLVRAETGRLEADVDGSCSRPNALTSMLRDLEWVGNEDTTRL